MGVLLSTAPVAVPPIEDTSPTIAVSNAPSTAAVIGSSPEPPNGLKISASLTPSPDKPTPTQIPTASMTSTPLPTETPTLTPAPIVVPTQPAVSLPQLTPQAGMRVVAVDTGSPAERAGFRVGQILISLNDQAIYNYETVLAILSQNDGKPVTAIVRDGDAQLQLTVTPRGGLIGITLCYLDRKDVC